MMNTHKKNISTKARLICLTLCAVWDTSAIYAQESTIVEEATTIIVGDAVAIEPATEVVADEAPTTIVDLANGLNTVWMLLAAMLVFFMQPGFALV